MRDIPVQNSSGKGTSLLYLLAPFDCAIMTALLGAEMVGRIWQRLSPQRPPTFSPPRLECSFVIPSWNSQTMLAESLPRLLEQVTQDGRNHEIIVVDNCSTDGTQEFVQRRFPEVRLVRSERNLYFAAGNRLGIAAASRDILVLMNNDTIVAPGFLNPLLMAFRDSAVFGVASKLSSMGRDGDETGNTHARFDGRNINWIHAPTPAAAKNVCYPVFWLHRGVIAMDHRKYLWLGGLDGVYDPLYMEDVDLSYRAWKVGWKCLLATGSEVSHHHRLDIPHAGEGFVHMIVRRNQYIFFWKNINSISMLAGNFLGSTGSRMRRARLPGIGVMRELHSFLAALKRLPAILIRRLVLTRRITRSDEEIFKLTAAVESQPGCP
jgi:GT2 family glycosyltransferase